MIDPVQASRDGRWDDVKKFLDDNDYLTIYEIAIKLGKSPSTIRNWRRKTGLSKEYPFKDRPKVRAQNLPKVNDQDVWDNGEWFEEYYTNKKYGIATIAKIISRSPRLVALRLGKYGIETRSHSQAVRSTNPCAEAEWLVFHYSTRDEYVAWAKSTGVKPDPEGGKCWSLKKCSEFAGVVPATIYNWLVRVNNEGLEINIRDLNESVAGVRNPFYGKKHSKETKEKLRQIALKNGNPITRAAARYKKSREDSDNQRDKP